MSDGRTQAIINLVTEELRQRRYQIDGNRHLRSIDIKIEFDSDGELSGFRFSPHEAQRVRPR